MSCDREQYTANRVSRRDVLKQIGLAGAVVTIPVVRTKGSDIQERPVPLDPADPFETLTATEGALLAAVVARIIPTDVNGPGAAEARAARYIDRALGGALSGLRQAYADGLAALDRYTRSSRRAPFRELSTRDQDSVLIDVETGAATGFKQPTASGFFTMVRGHTIQGTFGDPFYGGNADFVGWDLIGYHGLRLSVTADEQRLGAKLQPTHRSAYDHQMFVKAVAMNDGVDPHDAGRHVASSDRAVARVVPHERDPRHGY